MDNITQISQALKQDQVVAYPTESVFGLGCNPNSEQAVRALLALKNRPQAKGLILISPNVELLLPYIDEAKMNESTWQKLSQVGEQAISWVVPAKASVPAYLTGQFNTIAVRICPLDVVKKLCEAVGFALTSTSANLSGLPPCKTAEEVKKQFGSEFPILQGETLGRENPSEIRDIFSNHIFRQG